MGLVANHSIDSVWTQGETMCDPATAVMVTAAIASTYATVQGVKAQNKAAEHNAKMAEQNAELANIQAERAVQQGEKDAQRQRLKTQQIISQQRASMASSGVVLDQGSFADILIDTAEQGEIDALQIKKNAEMDAWNLKSGGQQSLSDASLLRSSKQNVGLAGGTTLLNGASSVASRYKPSSSSTKKD